MGYSSSICLLTVVAVSSLGPAAIFWTEVHEELLSLSIEFISCSNNYSKLGRSNEVC